MSATSMRTKQLSPYHALFLVCFESSLSDSPEKSFYEIVESAAKHATEREIRRQPQNEHH